MTTSSFCVVGRAHAVAALLGAAASLVAPNARSADYDADPSSYEALLGTLAPGDTLHLAAGAYPMLQVSNLHGTDSAWITIAGPSSGEPAVIQADSGPCCNTVEIRDSSYLALEHLTVDGMNVDGAFGVSAKDGTVHHIRIEGCTFLHHDTSQQNVAISTKTPTWGWIIRYNRIIGAGTGLYLGNSDGTCPFVGGLIEHNLVQDTIGYNMQVKWQQPRPTVEGMPTTPSVTVIRHNVFIKTDRESPDGDRPNLLVGGFPDSGAGSEDRYEIYGNFFFHNPRESLLQASGRVSVHDNVLVDVAGTAMLLQNHDLPLRQAWIYNNTIYAAGTGIQLGSAAPQGDAVVGNLVFASTPIGGSIADQRDNLVDAVANAGAYVANPSLALGEMDFYPLAGQCQGAAMDLSAFSADAAWELDFNGTAKGGHTFRGAYAGEGENPGWQLDADIKDATATPPEGGAGGTGAGSATGGAGTGANGQGADGGSGAAGNADETGGEDDGGGCRLPGREQPAHDGAIWLLGGLAALASRRKAYRSRVG